MKSFAQFFYENTNPIPDDTPYEVVDKQTGKVVWSGTYKNRNIARRVADKRDSKYGAYRFLARISKPKPIIKENSSKSIDVEYFQAIENNDIDKIKLMVAQAAKSSGYNSGIVYHGTPSGGFNEFRVSKFSGPLFFFTKSKDKAEYYSKRFTGKTSNPEVKEIYLRIENPLKVDRFDHSDDKKQGYNLRKQGYDSIETPGAYVVFLKDQIKSAAPITYKNGKVIPLSKRFNINSNLITEYRHNLADGTPTPSLQAHNGKNPNIVDPDKKNIHTIGPYKKENPKMNIAGSILTPMELSDLGYDYEHGKILNNVRNGGFGIHMTTISGQPVGRVFKSRSTK